MSKGKPDKTKTKKGTKTNPECSEQSYGEEDYTYNWHRVPVCQNKTTPQPHLGLRAAEPAFQPERQSIPQVRVPQQSAPSPVEIRMSNVLIPDVELDSATSTFIL